MAAPTAIWDEDSGADEEATDMGEGEEDGGDGEKGDEEGASFTSVL